MVKEGSTQSQSSGHHAPSEGSRLTRAKSHMGIATMYLEAHMTDCWEWKWGAEGCSVLMADYGQCAWLRMWVFFPQDGAALCDCGHTAWRSHSQAEDEDGGEASQVALRVVPLQ